jgi:hypothetical protein
VLAVVIAGFTVQEAWPQPALMRPLGYLPSFLFFAFAGGYLVALVVTWHRWRQRREGRWIPGREGWRSAWVAARGGVLSRRRMARLGVACLFLPLLLNTFGCWKTAIPWWAGFAQEEEVLELSRSMHGGALAWHWLQPVLGHPILTVGLDRIYFTWLPVFVAFMLWQAGWREPAGERIRFWFAITLVWLALGAAAATAGASAGPIFTDHVLPGSGAYREMFEYLSRVDRGFGLITMDVREILWSAHQGRAANPFTGISAFPSIHVAMAALYVLALWRSARRLALVAVVYTAAIVISSVHLGWHYAVDAYAGVIGAVVCWVLAGWLGRSFVKRTFGSEHG